MEDFKSEIEDWDLGAGIYISFYVLKSSLQEDNNTMTQLVNLSLQAKESSTIVFKSCTILWVKSYGKSGNSTGHENCAPRLNQTLQIWPNLSGQFYLFYLALHIFSFSFSFSLRVTLNVAFGYITFCLVFWLIIFLFSDLKIYSIVSNQLHSLNDKKIRDIDHFYCSSWMINQ